MSDTKPWIEERNGEWSVHTGSVETMQVFCSANQVIEVDKLYGPLAAAGVRVRLEYKGDVTDWVVEAENLSTGQWEEKARWDCQDNWPEDEP